MLLEIKILPRQNPKGRGCAPRVCVLKCDVCSETYERPYSHVQLDAKVHRCSHKCVYGSRSSDGLGGHGAEVVELQCLTCKKIMKLRRIGNERKWGKCCSMKCLNQYRSEHPELYVANTVMMHTLESAAKIKARALERSHESGYVHPLLGKVHSVETRARMRQRRAENPSVGEKNGMFGRNHSETSRAIMSEQKTQAIIEGRFRPYGTRNIRGYHTSIRDNKERFYRSSWEFALMNWLDVNDDVLSWDYECVRIAYYYDSNKRWYVPDFIVTFQDGHREMWEVKPKEFITSQKNMLKESAAREWCMQNSVQMYRTLTGDDLKIMKVL